MSRSARLFLSIFGAGLIAISGPAGVAATTAPSGARVATQAPAQPGSQVGTTTGSSAQAAPATSSTDCLPFEFGPLLYRPTSAEGKPGAANSDPLKNCKPSQATPQTSSTKSAASRTPTRVVIGRHRTPQTGGKANPATLPAGVLVVHITGKVTAGGTGLGNVDVWTCSTTTVNVCFEATSIGDGTYSVAVVANDSYSLMFTDNSGTYPFGFYDSGASGHFTAWPLGTAVAVATSDVPAINITLPNPAHISGKVTNAAATGLGSVHVDACLTGVSPDVRPGGVSPNATTGGSCYVATSVSDGTYSVVVAPNYSYRMYFYENSGTYVGGYYNSAAAGHFTMDLASATTLAIATGDVPGINITLPTAVHISGQVTNAAATGLANIDVSACTATGYCYYSNSASDGTYSVAVAPNNTYTLEFDDYSWTNASGYYESAASGHFTVDSGSATWLAIATGDVPGINITLPATVHISGKVANAGATGLAGINVLACLATSNSCSATTSASDGTYSVPVAPNNTYTLEFDDNSATYASGYYDSAAAGNFTIDSGSATPLAMATSDRSGINITLPAAVHISGQVTNAAATGLAQIDVWACPVTAGRCYHATSIAGGTYSVPVAPNSNYILEFDDNIGSYLSGFYDSGASGHYTADYNSATPVPVAAGDFPGINITLPATVHIRGKITNGAATGLSGIVASACGTSLCYNATSEADGTYAIPVAANDSYSIYFRDNSGTYAGGYYSGASDHYSADPSLALLVAVAASDVPNINVTLPTAVHISGTVQNASSAGIDDILVWTCIVGTGACFYGWTDATGHYTVAILPNQNYVVEFDDLSGTYSDGFYASGAAGHFTYSFGSATTVAVTSGDVSGINVVLPAIGSTYHPLTPARILDSRDGTGGLSGKFSAYVARTFQVTGSGGVPVGAVAVTGNLTVTQQSDAGYLFIGPIAMNNPTSSSLNFPVGDNRANAVTVALGTGGALGKLSITYVAGPANATTHVVFDVTGYFTPDTTGATYHPLTPARILDSRDGTGGLSGKFTSYVARTFQVTGSGGVPVGAVAITGNLTVTQQSDAGLLFIGPVATNNPTSSTLNFPVGDNRANAVTVALGTGGALGTLSITYVAGPANATAHVVFDVTGYFTPDMTGATYHPLTPARILDSRDGTGGLSGKFTAYVARTFQVTDSGGVYEGAVAVTGNLTVTQQSDAGLLFIGPVATNNPTSSTLNFPVGDNRANAVTVALGTGGYLGSLSVTYVAGPANATTHVVFDVTGYFTPAY